jgi:lipopolysaccharide cholinephosphotransferase
MADCVQRFETNSHDKINIRDSFSTRKFIQYLLEHEDNPVNADFYCKAESSGRIIPAEQMTTDDNSIVRSPLNTQSVKVDMKSLQKKILEIAVYLNNFCIEHGIVYYLMGGSALGALRHKGFIPWDDDFDVFMTYDNYMKFLCAAKTDLDIKRFYLQEENTVEWPLFFTKLRMNDTTFIEEDTKNRNMHQGVYIDIMCLNNVSENIIYCFLQYSAARLLIAQTLSERGYSTNKKILKRVAMFLCRYFVQGKVKQFLIGFVRSLNHKNTKKIGHFFGKAHFSKTYFPSVWLGIPRYFPFEDVELPVPQKVEEYLTIRYDNYMKMPDESTMKEYPTHAYFVDLKKSYMEYRNKNIN